jgi:hypothetical protein
MVDSGTAPWRLQSLLIRGGGAPDVHMSLVAGGGQGPTPAVTPLNLRVCKDKRFQKLVVNLCAHEIE